MGIKLSTCVQGSVGVRYVDQCRDVQISDGTLFMSQQVKDNGGLDLEMKGNTGSDEFKFTVYDYDTAGGIHDFMNLMSNNKVVNGQNHYIVTSKRPKDNYSIRLKPTSSYQQPPPDITTSDKRFFYTYEQSPGKQVYQSGAYNSYYMGVGPSSPVVIADTSEYTFTVSYPELQKSRTKPEFVYVYTHSGKIVTTMKVEGGYKLIAVHPNEIRKSKLFSEKLPLPEKTADEIDKSAIKSDLEFNDPTFKAFYYEYLEAPTIDESNPPLKHAVVLYSPAVDRYVAFDILPDGTTGTVILKQYEKGPDDALKRFPGQRFFLIEGRAEDANMRVHDDQDFLVSEIPVAGAIPEQYTTLGLTKCRMGAPAQPPSATLRFKTVVLPENEAMTSPGDHLKPQPDASCF